MKIGFEWKDVSAIDKREEMCNKWVFLSEDYLVPQGSLGYGEIPGSRRK
jgi:hypothetical protein